ncbi:MULTISPECIES: hypothetical protein [unclassified Microcoleus]|uniref:hypothetical protein n=1 Tax=unclassified Microcoleus TaxID=2642155 RepID=UPI001D564DBC|nr:MULTISPECIES: hypothetical protein [unclassified Microcoleus]MCC3440652.1 hypothetical protein [Microcoleus sp. PH2017_03_ELD_O_A]MCC3469851.1 hypothetical protein [Microcoleus sp. PH2017_06_SFM_O_A]MCC3504245.1 hypothetical protein [Microcoleus sp. PH2017_19_SFW_U_A]MCC3412376.1 hypothetical protein [Microcoleus sp. PH2017_02_FOX_O_A]MCC3423588.1 hypothetical protein [Microcoleus sp. PH2017_01_SCD_O_A]
MSSSSLFWGSAIAFLERRAIALLSSSLICGKKRAIAFLDAKCDRLYLSGLKHWHNV